MDEKKLFLLDAYALIYRAYYALMRNPFYTSDGRNTSAIYGFVNTLDEILRKENPQYLAVCFDPPHGKTFRHEVYPEYKAQRDKQPEDITLAIPVIKEIIKAWGLQIIEVPDFEADDVIGTLSAQASGQGFTTYMMTPDKDYGQLVRDNVFMYRPALKGKDFEVRGPAQVCERYGIADPRQVIDLLALEGDVSDNVPGCPGVGEKTASKLIAQFGSVENMLEHTDQIKGALRTKIETNAEQITFSKFLVTIRTDVPLDIAPEGLRRGEPDTDRLRELYKDLQFTSFLKKLGAASSPSPKSEAVPAQGTLFGDDDFAALPVADAPVPEAHRLFGPTGGFSLLETPEQVSDFVVKVLEENPGYVGVSVYAVGDEAMTAQLQGVGISVRDGMCAYIVWDSFCAGPMAAALAPIADTQAVTYVSQDVKRDSIILRRHNIHLTAPYYDIAVAHYVIKPDAPHELPDIAMRVLGLELPGYSMTATQRKKPLAGTPSEVGATVCARAEAVRLLRPELQKRIVADGSLRLLEDIEFPLISVLTEMEWTGVRFDTEVLAEMSRNLTARLGTLQQECWSMAGEKFNIASPTQVGEVLFGKMQIDPSAKKTKGGAWSTTEEILEQYRAKFPIVDLILQIRALRKLLATYIDALPKLINPATGKIHTTFNQTITATGRISSTNPNLQNLPIRTDQGREIRRAVIADRGDLILSADYSQIELRLMACLSGDPTMVQAFSSGEDIHRSTAAKIYHKDIGEVTNTQRRNAKTANFGIIYGISAFGLSQRLGIPRGEAKELIDGYLRTYPDVRRYMDESIERARRDGYVTTIMGRRRYLPTINDRSHTVRSFAERNAINAPLQGSAADIIKIAMVRIFGEMTRLGLQSRMILQVHDELVFNVIPSELEVMQELVIRNMESAYRACVPLTVASGVGVNWLEAH